MHPYLKLKATKRAKTAVQLFTIYSLLLDDLVTVCLQAGNTRIGILENDYHAKTEG